MIGGPLRSQWRLRLAGVPIAQAFAVVSDVERYPEFVPGALEARIIGREGARWRVDNAFGFGPIRLRFLSEAEVERPRGLTIRSSDGPWRAMTVRWELEEQDDACLVAFAASLDFRSAAAAALCSVALGEAERRVRKAFEARLKAAAR